MIAAKKKDLPLSWAAALLVAITLLTYLWVIRYGGFIWDDPQYILKNGALRSLDGLLAIWIHPTSIPQYYPIVHTTFWIEYHLWGLHPTGYHIINVLLHATAALLLWRLLDRLGVPGPWLIAALFAIHPVQVESVAWVTERKNVLSAVFYFAAAWQYLNCLDHDLSPKKDLMAGWNSAKPYLLSLGLFLAALLSKSVTCSLPAAILLVLYWKKGWVGWKDLRPLLPFFVAGLVMSLVTGRLEQTQVGAVGREWNWTLADRFLIAGRAWWFYIGKLFWPAHLAFIYPKWPQMTFVEQPRLILFPISAALAIGLLWLFRGKIGRGPLVALLFYSGTLLPALGFVNLFPMRYSFVADHFQYLACIGIFALFVGILCQLKWSGFIGIPILLACGCLAWQQEHIYHNIIDLWQDTLVKNPTSWMAWGNLGYEYAEIAKRDDLGLTDQQKVDFRLKARICYRTLLELAPDQAVAHWRWGAVMEWDGNLELARQQFHQALLIEPHFTPAMNSMGLVLRAENKFDQAKSFFKQAIDLDPGFAEAQYNYGSLLEKDGDWDRAIEHYTIAADRDPTYDLAQYALGNMLLFHKHDAASALDAYVAAVEQKPDRADYRFHLALALREIGQIDAARSQCQIALKLDPNLTEAKTLWKMLGG